MGRGGQRREAIWVLFGGGMAIHPLGLLLAKALGRPGSARGNPFDRLAFESTITMLLALPLAYGVSLARIEWFFPAMMMIIGGRYLVFATIYGLRSYWACGAALAMGAYVAAAMRCAPASAAFIGSAVEAAFSLALFAHQRGRAMQDSGTSPA